MVGSNLILKRVHGKKEIKSVIAQLHIKNIHGLINGGA